MNCWIAEMVLKLERFGTYKFVRPEHQAIWKPALSKRDWDNADAVFHRIE